MVCGIRLPLSDEPHGVIEAITFELRRVAFRVNKATLIHRQSGW